MKLKEEEAFILKKAEIGAPCRFTERLESKGRSVDRYPDVICELGCGSCGWNPEVKERRLKRRIG